MRLSGGKGWITVDSQLNDPGLTSVGNLRTAILSMGTTSPTPIDLDDIELTDAQLRPLVANGGFEQGGAHWFFSSDRDHLPWHGEPLRALPFVGGVLGTVAMLLILAGGLLHPRPRAHPPAGPRPRCWRRWWGWRRWGWWTSLLDMPRITVFLLLLAWLALNLRQPQRRLLSRPLPIAMNVRTALLAILLSAPAVPAAAATILVGPGESVTRIADAARLAKDDDCA